MTFDQVKTSLSDFNPTQLRDISLLANHLRPADTTDSNYHTILRQELESRLGTGAVMTMRRGVARRMYEQMRGVGLLQNHHDIARYIQRVALALVNAMKHDDAPLTWTSLSRYVDNLEDVLESEFPHYRVTGILCRR